MRTIAVLSGQSIWDIALQEYGSIEAVEYIVEDNNLELCDYVAPGTLLKLRDDVVDQQLVAYYASRRVKVSSDVEDLHGIGQWAIGINFQIQ